MSTHPQYHQQRYKDTCVDLEEFLLFCYHLRVCGQAHNPLISDSLDYVRLNKQDRTPSRCQPTMPRRQARWMMCSIADRRFLLLLLLDCCVPTPYSAKMKLTAILVAPLLVATSAFGVQQPASSVSVHKRASQNPLAKPAFRKAEKSALFRDPTVTRGGAVPGWAAYNEQLDKNPLTAKACTSLVGWALGDLLAQVSKKSTEQELYCSRNS